MFWTNFFDGDPPPSGDIKKLFGVVLLFIRYEGNCWLFLGRSLNAGHAGGGPLGGVFPWLFLPSGIVDGAPAPDTSLLDTDGILFVWSVAKECTCMRCCNCNAYYFFICKGLLKLSEWPHYQVSTWSRRRHNNKGSCCLSSEAIQFLQQQWCHVMSIINHTHADENCSSENCGRMWHNEEVTSPIRVATYLYTVSND